MPRQLTLCPATSSLAESQQHRQPKAPAANLAPRCLLSLLKSSCACSTCGAQSKGISDSSAQTGPASSHTTWLDSEQQKLTFSLLMCPNKQGIIVVMSDHASSRTILVFTDFIVGDSSKTTYCGKLCWMSFGQSEITASLKITGRNPALHSQHVACPRVCVHVGTFYTLAFATLTSGAHFE